MEVIKFSNYIKDMNYDNIPQHLKDTLYSILESDDLDNFEETDYQEIFDDEEDDSELNDYTPEEEPEIELETEPEKQIEDEDEDFVIYNDKNDGFSCELSVEGVDMKSCQVRLILETDEWNIFFNGKIDRSGKCEINLKKVSLFQEGKRGVAKLEIIADDTIFIPWESDFVVKKSKKVSVKINESYKKKSKIKLKRII
jgi:hypothetical protein